MVYRQRVWCGSGDGRGSSSFRAGRRTINFSGGLCRFYSKLLRGVYRTLSASRRGRKSVVSDVQRRVWQVADYRDIVRFCIWIDRGIERGDVPDCPNRNADLIDARRRAGADKRRPQAYAIGQ